MAANRKLPNLKKRRVNVMFTFLQCEKIKSSEFCFWLYQPKFIKAFFLRPSIQEMVKENKMNLLIFDAEKEEIVEWINWQTIVKL